MSDVIHPLNISLTVEQLNWRRNIKAITTIAYSPLFTLNFTVFIQYIADNLILKWTVDDGQMSIRMDLSTFWLSCVPIQWLISQDGIAFTDRFRSVFKCRWTRIPEDKRTPRTLALLCVIWIFRQSFQQNYSASKITISNMKRRCHDYDFRSRVRVINLKDTKILYK